MKKIKIDGGSYTKEELKEKLKEFDKPKWEVGFFDTYPSTIHYISLLKDGISQRTLINANEFAANYWYNIGIEIAISMGYAADAKLAFSNEVMYAIYFDFDDERWKWSSNLFGYIDTRNHAQEIMNILNESKDLKTYIAKMKGCE